MINTLENNPDNWVLLLDQCHQSVDNAFDITHDYIYKQWFTGRIVRSKGKPRFWYWRASFKDIVLNLDKASKKDSIPDRVLRILKKIVEIKEQRFFGSSQTKSKLSCLCCKSHGVDKLLKLARRLLGKNLIFPVMNLSATNISVTELFSELDKLPFIKVVNRISNEIYDTGKNKRNKNLQLLKDLTQYALSRDATLFSNGIKYYGLEDKSCQREDDRFLTEGQPEHGLIKIAILADNPEALDFFLSLKEGRATFDKIENAFEWCADLALEWYIYDDYGPSEKILKYILEQRDSVLKSDFDKFNCNDDTTILHRLCGHLNSAMCFISDIKHPHKINFYKKYFKVFVEMGANPFLRPSDEKMISVSLPQWYGKRTPLDIVWSSLKPFTDEMTAYISGLKGQVTQDIMSASDMIPPLANIVFEYLYTSPARVTQDNTLD